MKVDIRDAAAWGKLDQALTRLAVGKKGARAAGQPPHAASAPVLHGGGGGMEGEEDEFEPLSPDSSAGALGSGDALDAASSEDAEGAVGQECGGGGGGRQRGFMGGIRQQAAKRLRQLAETTAAHISR